MPGARRAPRDRAARDRTDETPIWAAHVAAVEGETVGAIAVRDRPRALPRPRARHPAPRRSVDRRPAALQHGRARCSIRSSASAGASGSRPARPPACTFSTLVAPTPRGGAGPGRQVPRSGDLRARRDARLDPGPGRSCTTCGISTDEAHLFQRLANRILYSDPTLRASAGGPARATARRPVGVCGAHGISGDLPIVLVRIDEPRTRRSCASCCAPTSTGGMKRLAVDLVILNEQARLLRPGPAGRRSRRSCGRASRGSRRRRRAPRGRVFILRADLRLRRATGRAPAQRRARRAAQPARARSPSR